MKVLHVVLKTSLHISRQTHLSTSGPERSRLHPVLIHLKIKEKVLDGISGDFYISENLGYSVNKGAVLREK